MAMPFHLNRTACASLLALAAIASACGDDGDAEAGSQRDATVAGSTDRDAAQASQGAGVDAGAAGGEGGPRLPPGAPCSNQACTDANDGLAAICRKDEQRCVSLLTTECLQVEGPFQRDDALILGSLDHWESAVLALHEINEYGQGLSGEAGDPRRPLVLLNCNSGGPDWDAVMDHLIDDLALPGMIASSSSEDLLTLSERAVSAGMFMVAPRTASSAITHLDDDGLVWRIVPSQGLTIPAIALSVAAIEARLRDEGTTGAIRVAIVSVDNFAAMDAMNALLPQLRFNGHGATDPENADNFEIIRYSLPTVAAQSDFDAVAERVLAVAPQIVIGLGVGETTGIALALEALWTEPAYRPEYVFNSYNRDEFWLSQIDAELARRVRGVYFPDGGTGRAGFESRYEQRFGMPPSFLVGYTYDAAYALAYASAVASAQGAVTGRGIADGMSKLVPPGPAIEVGPGEDSGNIQEALSLLADGESIDLQGVTGNLDFELETGEPAAAATPVLIWCVGNDQGHMKYLDSGQSYDPASDSLQGEFACPDNPELP